MISDMKYNQEYSINIYIIVGKSQITTLQYERCMKRYHTNISVTKLERKGREVLTISIIVIYEIISLPPKVEILADIVYKCVCNH